MKNLRGRPPRNVSEAGIVYLDSDGEDSDYSDSDVEPVFFPAAEFENDFDEDAYVAGFVNALHELAAEDSDSDDDDFPPPLDYPGNINLPDYRQISDEPVTHSPANNNPTVNAPNAAEEDNLVWQFFRSTAQVRHIVHDSFAIIQQQREQIIASQAGGPSSSVRAAVAAALLNANVHDDAVAPNLRGYSEDSDQEQPSTSAALRASRDREGPKMTDIPSSDERAASSGNSDAISKGEEAPESSSSAVEQSKDTESKNSSLNSSADDNNKTSSLVPYPDLPDYVSGGEDENEEFLHDNKRQSLKRKEPEGENSDDETVLLEITPGSSKSTKTLKNIDGHEPESEFKSNEEDEETCNPMVSDTEEFDEDANTFRGDRIGNTVYSERHVLKILMQWLENLPQYAVEKLYDARENEVSEEIIEKTILRMGTDFEEQMSLLWDMSAEPDVMNFLVENKIYTFIRDTVDRSACNRLTEIALGILANIISEPSVIDDFNVHDASMCLLVKVVELCWKVSDVAVLIQVFSVLRRIVWYLRNVAHVKRWSELLTSSNFIEAANFILRSSTNQLLLGNVLVLFFALIDCLNTENDCDDEESQENNANSESDTISTTEKLSKDERLQLLTKNYEPFCESDFVASLCEGLKELMKNPKPKNTRKNLTSTREKPAGPSSGCPTDDRYTNADDIDVPIPEGHVQQAILKGFSTLAILQKAPNGKEELKRHASQIISVILDFYRIFIICTEAVTRSDSLEYFSLSLHLLSFCHVNLDEVDADAIIGPVTTASKLVSQEEKDKEADTDIRIQLKDGVEFDSVSYIALVTHEYLAAVAEKFGTDCAIKVRNNPSYSKFFRVIDDVVSKFTEESATTSNNGKNDALT